MNKKSIAHETWLDLSEAAQFLGVHFTTLRRWADAGEIACIRTPGRRRRFSINVLEAFVKSLSQAPDTNSLTAINPHLQERAIGHARHSVQNLPPAQGWLSRMNDEQRQRMKGTGHHLMALLMQYNSHSEGAEVFLEEGKRITSEYSAVCSLVGLSLPETVQVFLFFRRSILESIHETGNLSSDESVQGTRLFQRTTIFFDDLLLNLIQSYQTALIQPPE